jgi:hypothetical protein
MIELGLLGLLVFVLVYSITLLRRTPEKSEEVFDDPEAQQGKAKSDPNAAAPSTRTA